jgi:hypothetical protein
MPAKLDIGLAVLVVAVAAGCFPVASKGTMPPPGLNGQVDPSRAPDFIAVAAPDGGILGYVPKEFVLSEPATTVGRPPRTDPPVYADDLQTLIGHMVAGKGFVPLGVNPDSVPNRPVEQGPSGPPAAGGPASTTIYVRNAQMNTAWIAVTSAGAVLAGQGYNSGKGVGCIDVPAGASLILLDRPPQDAGVRTIKVIFARGQANSPPTLWLDVDRDGAFSQGDGIPAWWSGDPQDC